MIEVRVGQATELDDFALLLEQAGSWLLARGIAQWPPGSNRRQLPMLRAMVDQGVLALAYESDPSLRLAGGCIVTTLETPEWQASDGEAASLHKLVVARAFAGRGLAARLVAWAEFWAREQGLVRLRLDCWDESTVLRRFYRDRGFEELHCVESHGIPVRLFEKRLARTHSET